MYRHSDVNLKKSNEAYAAKKYKNSGKRCPSSKIEIGSTQETKRQKHFRNED